MKLENQSSVQEIELVLMGFRIEMVNLNDSDPFSDLAMRSGGTEPESLFPVTFLQRC